MYKFCIQVNKKKINKFSNRFVFFYLFRKKKKNLSFLVDYILNKLHLIKYLVQPRTARLKANQSRRQSSAHFLFENCFYFQKFKNSLKENLLGMRHLLFLFSSCIYTLLRNLAQKLFNFTIIKPFEYEIGSRKYFWIVIIAFGRRRINKKKEERKIPNELNTSLNITFWCQLIKKEK